MDGCDVSSLTDVCLTVVMLVRIHALYGRNLRLLASLLAASLLLLGVIFVRVHHTFLFNQLK